MIDAATFWDKIAPKYATDPIKDMKAYEYTLGRTLAHLMQTDRVLELGCGTGNTACQIAPHVGTITGTDVSPAMIEIARARPVSGDARFEACSAAEALQLKGPFEAILAFNLFHLVPSFEDLLSDVHRHLPKGGHLISKTPCLADPAVGFKRHLIRAMIPPMQWIGKAPDVRFFTQNHLEHSISAAGFDIIEAGNFPAMSRYIVARKR